MGKKPPKDIHHIKAMLGDVVDSISGGHEASLNDIEPTPVNDETEAAYQEAQRKKAEEESSSGGESPY